MHWGLLTLVCTFLFLSDFVVGWSESRQTTIIAEQLTRSLNLNCIVNTTSGIRMPASRTGDNMPASRTGDRAPAKANAPQAVGFKCIHCSGEFSARTARTYIADIAPTLGPHVRNPSNMSRCRSHHAQTCPLGSCATILQAH